MCLKSVVDKLCERVKSFYMYRRPHMHFRTLIIWPSPLQRCYYPTIWCFYDSDLRVYKSQILVYWQTETVPQHMAKNDKIMASLYEMLCWHHNLHGTTPCMTSHPTWHQNLNGVTPYMASQFTWRHTLHGITPCMASHSTWHQILHDITLYMTS